VATGVTWVTFGLNKGSFVGVVPFAEGSTSVISINNNGVPFTTVVEARVQESTMTVILLQKMVNESSSEDSSEGVDIRRNFRSQDVVGLP